MNNIFIDTHFYLARFDGEYDSTYMEMLPRMGSFMPYQRIPLNDVGWYRDAALSALEDIQAGHITIFDGKSEPAMKAIQFLLPQARLGDIFISPDGTIFHLIANYDAVEYWRVVQSETEQGIPPTRIRRVIKDIPGSPEYKLVEVCGCDHELVEWVNEYYGR